ncbi:MAG: hypothetical protein JRF29_14950 [Deltaproteobacteria bacterium]|jgi:hypothetical protein|nr:hypothetical protein [Deltaproteobacteria bacterium]
MTMLSRCLVGFIMGISFFLTLPGMADNQNKEITENACARLQNAEIVWDLSKYRWMCCIIKNEDEYETCMPISDMQPLPKTGLKPLPPEGTKTIENSPQKP